MSKLYIGNATRQFFDFHYRLPESPSSRVQRIRPGGQVLLSGEVSQSGIDAVVEQHRKYGLVRVSEIDRSRDFAGLCYDVDRPIQVDRLRRAMDKHVAVLVDKGKEIRKNAAIASSNGLNASLEESGRPEGLRQFDSSIVEENPAEDSVDPVAEGVRVVPEGSPAAKGSRRKK